MFLPHFDVLCDLLLNRRTVTWNLFVLYNKKNIQLQLFISKSFSITRKPACAHFGKQEKKPFDVICCLYTNEAISLVAMHNKELVKKHHATVKLDSNGFSWNENLQRKQNWTSKSTNVKENAGKINSVFVIRAALWPEKLECFLEYCLSWKNTLGKHAVAVNTAGHLIRVLNERRVTDGGNLCPLWLVILKLVWHGIGDTLWLHYSWPRAVVSYTFLAVVPWNGLEHSRRKVRLRVYFNWI